MDKEKVKRALIFLGVACIVGGSFFWIENQRGHKNNSREPAVEESTRSESAQKENLQESSSHEGQGEKEESEQQSVEEQNMVNDFSKRLVNYDSVYKRNQSIKKFLTMKCIEENTIDVDPHVDVKAKGEILSVSVDLKEQHTYTVMAKETVNKSENLVVITIRIKPELKKVDQYEINYIRGGNQ